MLAGVAGKGEQTTNEVQTKLSRLQLVTSRRSKVPQKLMSIMAVFTNLLNFKEYLRWDRLEIMKFWFSLTINDT